VFKSWNEDFDVRYHSTTAHCRGQESRAHEHALLPEIFETDLERSHARHGMRNLREITSRWKASGSVGRNPAVKWAELNGFPLDQAAMWCMRCKKEKKDHHDHNKFCYRDGVFETPHKNCYLNDRD
jgi:hypothetical protein